MILTPRYLAGVADGVVDIFAQAENEILADIARRIIKTGGVTNTAGWQMQKMREAGMLNENTVKQLAAATNRSEAEIQRMLKDSYKRALSFDIDVIPADLQMSWSQIKDNPAFRAIMLQGVSNANQLVSNFTKTTAGAAQVAFFNSLDVSYLQYVTGAVTREDAVRSALKKLSQDGIYKVAYPQQNGGTYYSSVESAVRRALTTAVNQSCAKLQLANCDVLGTDLVETTAHLGARPSHAMWQGKVFSRTGSTSKYPNFEESTGYGRGDGLCGWNCRHSFFPFFEGYSKSAYEMGKFDSEENARLYEIEQKQRRYERMVREAKREVYTLQSGLDAADTAELQEGLVVDLQQAKSKLRNRQKLLRDHCNKHGLYNDYSRTYTAGYNGRNNMKSNKINIPKTLDNPVKSGIIENEKSKGFTGRHVTSQERIDSLIESDMSGIQFSVKPTYNPRIRSNGKTTVRVAVSDGRVVGVDKVEIGKQDSPSAEFLEDTIIHEELEARIALRSMYSQRYRDLFEASDEERHRYINRIIDRYFRLKGWYHDMG